MATNYWKDGNDRWAQNPGTDWTTGAAPTASDDAVIDQGAPVIAGNVGTVNSVTDASELDLEGGTLTTGTLADLGTLDVDATGSGGSSLTVNGTLTNQGSLQIGSSAITTAASVTVGNLAIGGSIGITGTSSAAASLIIQGSTTATFGSTGVLAGEYSLTGNALLQFASGQITGNAGLLTLDGANASIADAGATGSNSALDLASNTGQLTLDDGATLSTAAGFFNTGSIEVLNTDKLAATTTLDVNGSTAGFENSSGALDSDIDVSGNSRLVFSGGGQIGSIAEGGSLSISGVNAAVADASAPNSNSAVEALASNAGELSLGNGASLTTAAGFTNTGDIQLSNDAGVATTTTLTVNNTTAGFEDSTGALDSSISVSGNALLQFTGGTIASIGDDGSLAIDGTNAAIDSGGSSAVGALTSNAGTLSLDDGASLTTAAGFVSTGEVELANTMGVATTTTLNAGTTAGFEDSTGALDSVIGVSGNSVLNFASGTPITSIGGGFSGEGELALSGANASVTDAALAPGSDNALALASNNGILSLDNGATLTTPAGLNNAGIIEIGLNSTNAATSTLDINSTAGLGSDGVLTGSVELAGNALLEFGQGQITDNEGFLSLDGTAAFVADASATSSNSALSLTLNSESVRLDDGASLTTGAGFVNKGIVQVENTDGVATTTTFNVNGTTAGFEDSTGALDSGIDVSGNSQLVFSQGGQIATIGNEGSLAIDGPNAFVADATAAGSNSALATLASNQGELSLGDGATLTTSGALANTGFLSIGETEEFGGPAASTATPPTTLLDVNSAAGLGTAQTITGNVEIGDNSILEFAQGGQITSIANDAGLSLDGPFAFVADAGATTSNSALTSLASIGAGSSLSLADGAAITTTGALTAGEDASISLDNGASLITGGALTSTGSISLDGDWTVPTLLEINASPGFGTPGTVTGSVSVAGNSSLVFEQSGTLTTIAQGGSLSIDGTQATIAVSGAAGNSALTGLADNAGSLSLGDGASITTGPLTSTGSVSLTNTTPGTQTSLVVNGTTAGFTNTSGNLVGEVDVSGNSLLEFTQNGTITGIAQNASLSLDGATALVADGSAPTTNSALSGLADNAGSLSLADGAVVTTTGPLKNTGSISIGGTPTATSILDIAGPATAFGDANGNLVGSVAVAGNSLLEFSGGSLAGIGQDGSLSIDGPSALVADATAPTTNSALTGLASNAGYLSLSDGAVVVVTSGPLNNTGTIDLGVNNVLGSTAETILDIGGSAAAFGDVNGNLVGTVDLKGNSLLEFSGGSLAGIGQDASLSIDGTSAFFADSTATTSNSALSGLASNAGSLTLDDGASALTALASNTGDITLDDGASITTMAALANTGTIDLGVDNTSSSTATTTLDIGGSAAAFGDANGNLVGTVDLKGNSLLEFSGGSLAGIGPGASLLIDGTNAFVADATAPDSNSALSGLTSNAGYLSLNDGASITTMAALANTGTIDLGVDNTSSSTATTTLDIGGSAAAFGDANGNLVGTVDLKGNSLLEFSGGSLAGIGPGASLSIDGTSAFVADSGMPPSNSALSGLTSNAGFLSLNDGASITTMAALANTGSIDLGVDNTGSSTATTTLDIGGSATAFGDANGDLVGSVALAGNSLLEFTGGSLAGIGQDASLSIDGTSALVADANALTSNSALTGLTSNAGQLSLNDGAVVVATSGTLDNTGNISLATSSETGSGPLTILDIASSAGFSTTTPGELTGSVDLSGNSLLEFAGGGTITSIGDANNYASLAITGTNAFLADASAPTSNSALSGLASNFGQLTLEDGAVVVDTSASGLASTGGITLDTNSETGSGPLTILDIGSAAGFSPTTPGELTGSVNLSGNSLLEFASGSITSIGDANNTGASLSIDGTNAFLADASAPTSNSALSGLASNFGELSLSDGASVTISNSPTNTLTNTGTISIGSGSLNLGSTGTLASSGSLYVGDSEQNPATLTANALDLTGGQTYFDSNAAVDAQSLTLSGNALLDVEAPASAITSPSGIGFAAGAMATLRLGANAIPATGGAFADPINGFSLGDTIDLTSLVFAPPNQIAPTTATLSGSTLTVTNGTTTDTLTLMNPGPNAGFTTIEDGSGGTEVQMVCFAQGTRIATVRGREIIDVAVEDLVVGDLALTAAGAARPIRWLGHRTVDCRRHPAPADTWPVRVAAHAFGDNRPTRDLFLSPGHPVLVGADEDGAGGHLVPIMCLVNGTTVARVSVDAVTYWHVELDAHDILLAEGLPAESYLDWGDRGFFGEAAAHAHMNPDFVVPGLAGRCRRVAINGAVVEAERRRLDMVFVTRLAAACRWPSGDAPVACDW